MDWSKLPPAPWTVGFDAQMYYVPGVITGASLEVCQGVCLLRNALDVQMRRGWTARLLPDGRGWCVDVAQCQHFGDRGEFTDPATVLCAADEWYKAKGK